MSAWSSWKINKYEYLTGEKISPSNEKQIIEQSKFTYYPHGKAFDKNTRTIEDEGKNKSKQWKIIKKQQANTNVHSYENKLLFLEEK